MNYELDAIYHVYNRCNELMFHKKENYIYFLGKIRKHVLPYADILSYCLMPNHFHLLICVKDKGVELEEGSLTMQRFSKSIGHMLSSYTQAINRQEDRKGSLFAHNTKSIMLNMKGNDYLLNCFMYIHQNPLLAGLVEKIEDWEYSSYPEYVGKRNGTLVNLNLGLETLNIDKKDIEFITNQLLVDKTDKDFI